jgi:hypothetical protein
LSITQLIINNEPTTTNLTGAKARETEFDQRGNPDEGL